MLNKQLVKMIDQYIAEYPKSKNALNRGLKFLDDYFNGVDLWKVKREQIYNFNNDCFRNYLIQKVSSDHGKNRLLYELYHFYNYQIMIKKSTNSSFKFENPFDYKFDKFKLMKIHSTYREVIPLEIIEKMKKLLVDKINKEVNISVYSLLYVMLSIPIRGRQAQMLDSGLWDEYIYDFKDGVMIKNLNGVKKRKEGFIQSNYYNGWTSEKKEYLWITTNKNMNCGYELNYVSNEMLGVIQKQIDYVRRFEVGNHHKYSYLFYDSGRDSFISRSSILKIWKWLLSEVGCVDRNGKGLYGLHNIRVSLISHWMDMGLDVNVLSKNITAHHSLEMTLYYYRSDQMKNRLKSVESNCEQKLLVQNVLKLGFIPK